MRWKDDYFHVAIVMYGNESKNQRLYYKEYLCMCKACQLLDLVAGVMTPFIECYKHT